MTEERTVSSGEALSDDAAAVRAARALLFAIDQDGLDGFVLDGERRGDGERVHVGCARWRQRKRERRTLKSASDGGRRGDNREDAMR